MFVIDNIFLLYRRPIILHIRCIHLNLKESTSVNRYAYLHILLEKRQQGFQI